MSANAELRLIKVIRKIVEPLITPDSNIVVSSVRDEPDNSGLSPHDVQVVTRRDGGIPAAHGLVVTTVFTVLVFSQSADRADQVLSSLIKKPVKAMKTEKLLNYVAESAAVELEGFSTEDFEVLAVEIAITTRSR